MRTSPHPRTISLSPEKPTSPRVPTSTFLKHYYKHSQLILFVLIYSFLIYPTHLHIVIGARNKCPVPPYRTTKLHSFQSKDTAAQIIIKPQKKKIKKPYKITFCHAGRKQRDTQHLHPLKRGTNAATGAFNCFQTSVSCVFQGILDLFSDLQHSVDFIRNPCYKNSSVFVKSEIKHLS